MYGVSTEYGSFGERSENKNDHLGCPQTHHPLTIQNSPSKTHHPKLTIQNCQIQNSTIHPNSPSRTHHPTKMLTIHPKNSPSKPIIQKLTIQTLAHRKTHYPKLAIENSPYKLPTKPSKTRHLSKLTIHPSYHPKLTIQNSPSKTLAIQNSPSNSPLKNLPSKTHHPKLTIHPVYHPQNSSKLTMMVLE